MKYFAEFNAAGERIAGYVADGMPFGEADIKEKFPGAVEISEADQEKYITGRYMRGADGKPVERPKAEPAQQIVTPTVDRGTADMWEAILSLSAKIEALEVK